MREEQMPQNVQNARNEVQTFLSQLSMVNHQLGRFIVNLAVGWQGLYSSDTDEQEHRAVMWANKLIKSLGDPCDPLCARSLENYADSVLELAAIRDHADKVLRGHDPLGAQIYARLVEGNPDVDLNTDTSLEGFAKDLGLEKQEAADVRAFLLLMEGEERAA